jgi:hypothetical protein
VKTDKEQNEKLQFSSRSEVPLLTLLFFGVIAGLGFVVMSL